MRMLIVSLASLVSISNSAFADSKDLNVFNSLIAGGAESEQFMSQSHIGVDGVRCVTANRHHPLICTMTDISANGGQGQALSFQGKAAQDFLRALKVEVPTFERESSQVLTVASVRCSQAVEGVMDGSEAERTQCSIDLSCD